MNIKRAIIIAVALVLPSLASAKEVLPISGDNLSPYEELSEMRGQINSTCREYELGKGCNAIAHQLEDCLNNNKDSWLSCKGNARKLFGVQLGRIQGIKAKKAEQKKAEYAKEDQAPDADASKQAKNDPTEDRNKGVWMVGKRFDDFDGDIRYARVVGRITYTTERYPTDAWIGVYKRDNGEPYVNMSLGIPHICSYDDTIAGDAIIDGEREKITFYVSDNNEYLHIKSNAYWIKKLNKGNKLQVRLYQECGGDEARVEFNIRGHTQFL